MLGFSFLKRTLRLAFLFLLLGLPACLPGNRSEPPVPQIVEVTRLVENTVVVTQIVEVEKVVTATPQPSPVSAGPQTNPETELTPMGSDSGLTGDALAGWCVPKDAPDALEGLRQSGAMPEKAYPLQVVNGQKEIVIEVKNCSFVYTFNTPIPAGVKLKIYDAGKSPFLTVDLIPTAQFPNKAYATIDHPYVVNPPFWSIPYRLEAISPEGQVLRSDEIVFKRGWTPKPCYDGSWPDPLTLKCKFMGEAHPWDPWYGKENPYEPTPSGE